MITLGNLDTHESTWTFAEPSQIYYVDGQKADAIICNQCFMYFFIEWKQWKDSH